MRSCVRRYFHERHRNCWRHISHREIGTYTVNFRAGGLSFRNMKIWGPSSDLLPSCCQCHSLFVVRKQDSSERKWMIGGDICKLNVLCRIFTVNLARRTVTLQLSIWTCFRNCRHTGAAAGGGCRGSDPPRPPGTLVVIVQIYSDFVRVVGVPAATLTPGSSGTPLYIMYRI